MNFRLKSSIQWFLSWLPWSTKINRLMQLYITKSLPISDDELNARIFIANRHINSYYAATGKLPVHILDIGSGSDLCLPLIMTRVSKNVVASDVNRLASHFLVKNIVERLSLGGVDKAGVKYIVYNPPIIPIDDSSFDLITSTSVLEHVPENQLQILAKEIYRLLKDGGVSTHHIAHKDHWSDSDERIHSMNYLRYSNIAWKKYNPPLMYQNRLLSSYFINLFAEVGFEVAVNLTKTEPPNFPIDDLFKDYKADDLSTSHTWLTLMKKGGKSD